MVSLLAEIEHVLGEQLEVALFELVREPRHAGVPPGDALVDEPAFAAGDELGGDEVELGIERAQRGDTATVRGMTARTVGGPQLGGGDPRGGRGAGRRERERREAAERGREASAPRHVRSPRSW
jgi:hypothetical protein